MASAAIVLALLNGLPVPAVRAAEPARCARSTEAAASLLKLRRVLAAGRFVAYQPTDIRIVDGRASRADEAGIEADLRVLRPHFDGLLTYGAGNGADRVADVAARLGFRAVVIGVWQIEDGEELDLALAAARRHPAIVLGLSIGNERVLANKVGFDALARRIGDIRRRAPSLLLTTTEPFHLFQTPAARPLLAQADFLLMNVHPAFQPWFRDAPAANAADFVVNVVRDTTALFCGPVIVKETGVPTAPATMGFTPDRQQAFYAELRRRFPARPDASFAYFSAFDAAWRVADSHPVEGAQPQEGSWGLFTERRLPKPAASDLPRLR